MYDNEEQGSAMAIAFTKMHGSGNDFIVIDHRDGGIADIAAFARLVCRRRIGVGADGLVLIESDQDTHFSWRYINADGSDGDMCGNGAMCGARFAVEHGIAPTDCAFATASGVVHAEVDLDSGRVSLAMPDAQVRDRAMRLDAVEPDLSWSRIDVGVPHVVAFIEDADAVPDLERWGRSIRHHPALAPEGANVNIVHRIDDRAIRMRTYERGVEAETLACGTGAIASAIAASIHLSVEQPVSVITSSGMPLTVTWDPEADLAANIRLTGISRVVAEGTIRDGALAESPT